MASTAVPQAVPVLTRTSVKWSWLIASVVVLLAILALPTPASLPVAGHRALAILGFAIVLWISEAVAYPVSASLIVGLISFLIGLAPNVDKPAQLLTTKGALALALAGFSDSAAMLVAGALFLAAAMQVTKLDRRIALWILSKVGSKTKGILIGSILVGVVLSFFVPSTTARVGAIVPIILGMVSAFGLKRESRFAALMMIASAQTASIWNIGIKTAAAQNVVAIGLMEKAFKGATVTWPQWFMYAAPWAIIMSVVLYFIMLKVIPPELDEIPNGQAMVKKQLEELGPVSPVQWRLMIISVLLLFFWATEKYVHPFDSTTTTLAAVAVMLTPGIGVFSWEEAEKKVPWGTIVLFAVGISLGGVLLKTKAATWLAGTFVGATGVSLMPAFAIVAVLGLFNIFIHFGFASATSLSTTLIPIVIAMMTTIQRPDLNPMGMVLIQQFLVSFGFILPVNAPQNMVAYGTGTFTSRDFMKSGIPITIIGYLLILLMGATYWKWVGLM